MIIFDPTKKFLREWRQVEEMIVQCVMVACVNYSSWIIGDPFQCVQSSLNIKLTFFKNYQKSFRKIYLHQQNQTKKIPQPMRHPCKVIKVATQTFGRWSELNHVFRKDALYLSKKEGWHWGKAHCFACRCNSKIDTHHISDGLSPNRLQPTSKKWMTWFFGCDLRLWSKARLFGWFCHWPVFFLKPIANYGRTPLPTKDKIIWSYPLGERVPVCSVK